MNVMLNLNAPVKVADANGTTYDVLFLAGMNKLANVTKIGFEVIRIQNDQLSSKVTTEGYSVYTEIYDAEGENVLVSAEEKDVKYLSALEIDNIDNACDVTYIYRPFAVKDGVTYYGAWATIAYDAVAQG